MLSGVDGSKPSFGSGGATPRASRSGIVMRVAAPGAMALTVTP